MPHFPLSSTVDTQLPMIKAGVNYKFN